MPNLGDYMEDVPFNYQAATALLEELTHTASVLQGQVGQRQQLGTVARESWQGEHAMQFDDRVRICMRDAENYATAMTSAANGLRVLAEYAQAEQARRVEVRIGIAQWEAACAEWAAAGYAYRPPMPNFPPPIEPPNIPPFQYTPTPRGAA